MASHGWVGWHILMPNLWGLSIAGASCEHTDGYKHIIDPNPSKWYCVLGHKPLCLPALCRCNTVRVRLPSLALCEHTTAPLPAPSFGALQTRHCAEIMCFGGACHRRYLAERGIKSKCVPYDGTCENGASLLGPARNFPKCYHAMLPKATVAHGDAAASHGAAIATTTLDVPRGSPVQQPPDHTCICGANAGKCCALKHSVGLPWHAF